ncbi:ankyrin repeat domain-containing protein [Wolbachia endosymbiont (group A) of Myopa testacea]|uniref:ankyrin repeat domain-containing protein n=1 Tax=Wolbachia endosymbiont (group A) of Myopa testacea TaxID=3066148 RepID=UPI003132FDA0
MSESIRSGDIEQMFQMEDYRPSREKLQEIREDFMIVLRYYLGYGQSRERDSESIIDRCRKAIEHAEEEGMEEVRNIDNEKEGRILSGLRKLLSIPVPSDGANLLGKLGLYHNSGIDEFSDIEREALRSLFDGIDLYKKLSAKERDMGGLGDNNSRRLYEDLLNIIRGNQDPDGINQDIEGFLDHNEIDITSRDPGQGITFLGQAIIEGKADYAISLINYYLHKGIDISAAITGEGWTPLHVASLGGQSSITRSFFIEILNPIERYINRELALAERNILVKLIHSEHEIVREINYSMNRIAKELIAKGADPNKPTLGSAVSYGKLSLYGPFSDDSLPEEVNQEYVGPFNPDTPFTFVVLHRRTSVLLDMINKVGLERLDFSRKNIPLHYIAKSIGINDEGKTNEEMRQERDLAEVLARAMGDISKKNYLGNTPLHEAVINRNRYIVKLFLKRDYLFPQMKILSIQNLEGRTAIHEAAARNEHEILELLVRVATQKDLDIRDGGGRTAIELIEEAVQGLETSPEYERTLSILRQSDYQSWKTRELGSKSSFPSLPDVPQDYGNAYLDRARRFYQEGFLFNERGKYSSAIISLTYSIGYYQANGLNSPDEKVELGHTYWLLGFVYMRSSQLKQAKPNIEESIKWYKSAERYDLLEHPYQQLARIHLDLDDIVKGYMNGHIQTIEDSNARIDKLCSHLALAGIYSVVTERQLESSLRLNPEHVKWKQSFHYSEAYKLTQGNLDNSAHVVLQREMGIAYNENIGTYNIQQCVAVVAHDTKTDKVALSHFDRYSGPLKFIEQILEQFPSQNKIDIHVYGGRDRATFDESGRYLVSDNNINQVLKQIYHYSARVNVISINVARSLLPGVVYVVKDRKLVHATPNHPDKSISSRAAMINLSLWPKKTGEYLYPIYREDFSKSEEKRIVLFNDEQKRRLQEIGEQQKQRLNSEGSARSLMWSSNQILHPIDDTLQQGVSSMEVQQVVLNNIDRVAGNPNIEPIIDRQLVLAQTNRQNPSVEDFIDYYMKESQPSNLDDIEIDASLSGDLDNIEMLDLDGCLGQGNRKKRSTKGSCIDSRDEENAEEQGKKEALIRELFDSNEIREEMGVAELYDVLLKASEQISEGGTLSQDIEKVLVARTKDVNLDLIDPEIRNIVEEIKGSINDGKIDKKRTKDILSKPKISNMLVNAAGRISFIRSIHGTLYALSQGDMLEFGLGAGEMAFSPLSDLIENSIVNHLSKAIGQIKGGAYIARGVGGSISNVFDIVDLIISLTDLFKAKKGSKELRDAIAGVTFSSVSVLSGVVFAVFSMPIAGTIFGFTMVMGQGFYSGASMLAELREYRLTADEELRTFWHTFALQPLPENVEYIVFRKQVVDSLIRQKSEALGNDSSSVLAHMMGLGHTTVEGDNSRPDDDCHFGGSFSGMPALRP